MQCKNAECKRVTRRTCIILVVVLGAILAFCTYLFVTFAFPHAEPLLKLLIGGSVGLSVLPITHASKCAQCEECRSVVRLQTAKEE
jgi:hypothetical protein